MTFLLVMALTIHVGSQVWANRKDELDGENTYLHLYRRRDALMELYGCWLL